MSHALVSLGLDKEPKKVPHADARVDADGNKLTLIWGPLNGTYDSRVGPAVSNALWWGCC